MYVHLSEMNIHSSKIKHVSPTPYIIFVVVSDSQFQNKGGGKGKGWNGEIILEGILQSE